MSNLTKLMKQAASGAAGESVYVEDVFSTYLVTGTGTAPAVNNGIDLSGEGGLVWLKKRSSAGSHDLFDTERGANKRIIANNTIAEDSKNLSFTSTGFSNYTLDSGIDYVSFSFRKQAGFFDVVTYTGDSVTGRAISHGLKCKPAVIIIRALSGGSWLTLAKASSSSYKVGRTSYNFALNTNEPADNISSISSDANNFYPDDVRPNSYNQANYSGTEYVAYLFADGDESDAAIFGDDSDESIIKCGSFSAPTQTIFDINLGWEPQFFFVKKTSGSGDWYLIDVMRGFNSDANSGPQNAVLRANTTGAEGAEEYYRPTATGIQGWHLGSGDYIYIAIRRPMKTPEAATDVFDTNNYVGNDVANRALTSGFVTDLNIFKGEYAGNAPSWFDRLRGNGKKLESSSTGAESDRTICSFDVQDGIYMPSAFGENNYNHPSYTNNYGYINYQFRRATGFFDLVAYTGTGNAFNLNHNLGVAPELAIIKERNAVEFWIVGSKSFSGASDGLYLNSNAAKQAIGSAWTGGFPTAATSSSLAISISGAINTSSNTYIAYLFATLAGISKVGSYAGTGSDINVDCGFSAGARFVMVKRTDSTGDWYFWDTDRGIVAGNDSYMIFNDTDGENTSNDYIDPLSSGFTITSSAPAALNTSGGSYIFLAIA